MGTVNSKRKINIPSEVIVNAATKTDNMASRGTSSGKKDDELSESDVTIRRLVHGRTISTQTGQETDIPEADSETQQVPRELQESWQAYGQTPGADPLITNYEIARNDIKYAKTIQTQTSRISRRSNDDIIQDQQADQWTGDDKPDKTDVHESFEISEANSQVIHSATADKDVPEANDYVAEGSEVDQQGKTDEERDTVKRVCSTENDRDELNDMRDVRSQVATGLQTEFTAPGPEDRSFSDISLQRFGKYKVRLASDNQKCIISAATFLETGDVVVIDRANQKVKFVDSQFRYVSSHELPARPWAVCARGVDVYVTMGNTEIQHLFVKDMIIEPERTIHINGRCLGICVYREYIAVGLQIGQIVFLDTVGETHSLVELPKLESGKPCNPWNLCVTSEENILVTDSDAGIVFCISIDSDVIFKYSALSSPRTTAIDASGNIIIVGRDNLTGDVVRILQRDNELKHTLHIETPRTSDWRSLMTWEQLEFVPYCVCYRRDRVLLVGGIQDSLKMMWLC